MNKSFFVFFVLIILTACAPKTEHAIRQDNYKQDLAFTRQAEDTLSQEQGDKVREQVDTISGTAISLRSAIDYALAHNLDTAVSKRQIALQREKLTGSYWRMLPSLMVNAELSTQNHHVPSSSKSWNTGTQSLEPSISQDLKTSTQSAELSWNLLNLAVDYQRTQQSKYRVGMSRQQLERVKQNLALDVTRAYMRCAIAKGAYKEADALISEALERQKTIQARGRDGLDQMKNVLNGEIDIINLRDSMRRFRYDYKQARKELAQLLGVEASVEFSIAGIDLADIPLEKDFDLEKGEREALISRPEMFEMDMQEEEAKVEADIAFTQMFPAVTPFARYSRDENSYLSRKDWNNVGLRLSWDLMTIPRLNSEQNVGYKQARLVRKQRQAKALAIVTQLNLAVIEYHDAFEALPIATELEEKQSQMLEVVKREVKVGTIKSDTLLLRTNQQYLEAKVKRLTSYADLIIAKVKIYNSLGRKIEDQDLSASSGFVPAKTAKGEQVAKTAQ